MDEVSGLKSSLVDFSNKVIGQFRGLPAGIEFGIRTQRRTCRLDACSEPSQHLTDTDISLLRPLDQMLG